MSEGWCPGADRAHADRVDRRRAAWMAAVNNSRIAAEAARKAKKARAKRAKQLKSGRRKPPHKPPKRGSAAWAAIKLQARLRGKIERRKVELLKRGEDPRKWMVVPATKVQAAERGRQDRKKARQLRRIRDANRALSLLTGDPKCALMVRG